ncbi:MAG: PIN domain nuclease [Bryobacteraceae bacterium]
MKAIADTGFLVAFGNRKDYHHEWAVGIAEGVTEPLVTCEAVLWRSWPHATRIESRIWRIFA